MGGTRAAKTQAAGAPHLYPSHSTPPSPHPCIITPCGPSSRWLSYQVAEKPVPLERRTEVAWPLSNLVLEVKPSQRSPCSSYGDHLVQGEEYQTVCTLVWKSTQSYRETWILCCRADFPRLSSLFIIFTILSWPLTTRIWCLNQFTFELVYFKRKCYLTFLKWRVSIICSTQKITFEVNTMKRKKYF